MGEYSVWFVEEGNVFSRAPKQKSPVAAHKKCGMEIFTKDLSWRWAVEHFPPTAWCDFKSELIGLQNLNVVFFSFDFYDKSKLAYSKAFYKILPTWSLTLDSASRVCWLKTPTEKGINTGWDHVNKEERVEKQAVRLKVIVLHSPKITFTFSRTKQIKQVCSDTPQATLSWKLPMEFQRPEPEV